MRAAILIEPGIKFGRLTVLSSAPDILTSSTKHPRHKAWNCRCECGNETVAQSRRLREGTKRSCGCLQNDVLVKNSIRHGLHHTNAYKAWSEMMKRCYRPNHISYHNYGGRGIRVCARWHNVENFVVDMGQPADGLSLDRIESDIDYQPGNCRWADRKTQNRNKRSTIWIEAFGEKIRLVELAEKYGIKYETLRKRINDGLSPEQAATIPIRPKFWKGHQQCHLAQR